MRNHSDALTGKRFSQNRTSAKAFEVSHKRKTFQLFTLCKKFYAQMRFTVPHETPHGRNHRAAAFVTKDSPGVAVGPHSCTRPIWSSSRSLRFL